MQNNSKYLKEKMDHVMKYSILYFKKMKNESRARWFEIGIFKLFLEGYLNFCYQINQ